MSLKIFNSLEGKKYTLSKVVFPVMMVSALFPMNCYADDIEINVEDDIVSIETEEGVFDIPKREFELFIADDTEKIGLFDNDKVVEVDKSEILEALYKEFDDNYIHKDKVFDISFHDCLQGTVIGIALGSALGYFISSREKKMKLEGENSEKVKHI